MAEEVGTYIRVAVLMVFTASFLSAIVNVTIMGIGIMNSYNNKYTNGLVTSVEGSVLDLSAEDKVAAPIVYSALIQSINEFDAVEIGSINNNGVWTTSEIIYKYDDTSKQNLEILLSKYRMAFVRIGYTEPGVYNNSLKTIRVVIVKDLGD